MNILSIQSHVAYGHVGNSAAVFPLQRLGVEVWPVHTVQFSNHPAYGDFTGEVFDARLVRSIVAGIDQRGVLGECDGVLSGYIGSPEIGAAIVDAVTLVKAANPAASYCCDPVIGDVGRGVYVADGVADFIKTQAVRAADVVTPNHFELDFLTEQETRTAAQAFIAIDMLHALGPRTVMVTSVHLDDTPEDSIDLLVSADSGRYRIRTPRLPITISGSGDMIAALFFAHFLSTGSAGEALSLATSTVYGVLSKTAEAGSSEILLVREQSEILKPSELFKARRLGVDRQPKSL